MRVLAYSLSLSIAVAATLWGQTARTTERRAAGPPAAAAAVESAGDVSDAVERGARWLASVQGPDGGWGQDGGSAEASRPGERLESGGNDVANTAVAALALLKAGKAYEPHVQRALAFVLQHVEASPADGLAVTDRRGTQIQRKLGPYIDTFLTSMLLVQMDGRSTPAQNARIRQALTKTVAKIEQHQLADGSWNHAGGWAPVLGTSMASRSLFEAQQKGVAVSSRVLDRAEVYTVNAVAAPPPPKPGTAVSVAGGASLRAGPLVAGAPAEAAGVALYQQAQALEQLSRTPQDRRQNAAEIDAIQARLSDQRFVSGFGSMGGEEFFSYLNIGDSLKRTGGEAWTRWHTDTTRRILSLQNADGTWAGHHCITGRVAMTSAAILNLTIDRAH
jgi:hypothetical protein